MSDLALQSELALASQTRLNLARGEGEAATTREQLNKLMGVWGTRTAWKPAPSLMMVPQVEVSLEHLESVAIAKRLDVGAARRELQALESALSLALDRRCERSPGDDELCS